MAGFAHICVVLVRGSRLLCLVVHISKQQRCKSRQHRRTTRKEEEGQSNKIQKFRVWMSQQKPRCLVFLSCFFAVVFPSCSAFLCCRLFASVPHGGCGRTARLAAPAQHPTLCTRTYQRARRGRSESKIYQ